ncbi:MAG: L-rhamnose isomerase [Sedimentisphaerales bacterium]|nr:L-rhamnose isomerase [Sedimentisphaerales bacterium]
MANPKNIEKTYQLAQESYGEWGVDTRAALKSLKRIAISMHCWQGDDVRGFERPDAKLDGGIQATGNYPGAARTIGELRCDIEQALKLIPGKHRLNLHACYLDHGGKAVDRDKITVDHFQSWIDWAKANGLGMDFNPTYFSHPMSADGFTLSHADPAIRKFWIDHGVACRKIAAAIGKQLNNPSVINFWIPDGYKDIPVDRMAPRQRLVESLDSIFTETLNQNYIRDAVEAKLFGIGAESYTVGSHEFYLGYAVSRKKLLCLDAGHFHPTEVISDKLSAVLEFVPEVLLHVSRPVRWDSDHVVILNDELVAIAQEIIRSGQLSRIHIGLDFFDASINRIAAWTIGMRAMLKALLFAFLEPTDTLREIEHQGNYTRRLGILEELKTLPFAAVWDYYCLQHDVPIGAAWLEQVRDYETRVLKNRG